MKKWFVFWGVISFLGAQEPDSESLSRDNTILLVAANTADNLQPSAEAPLPTPVALRGPSSGNQGREVPDRNVLSDNNQERLILPAVDLSAVVAAFLQAPSQSIETGVNESRQPEPVHELRQNNIIQEFQPPLKPVFEVPAQEPPTLTEQLVENGFKTNDELAYKTHSETFRAIENPWGNIATIEQKEKIGRELFLSATDLNVGDDKAALIKLSADLGIATACLDHYEGIRDGKHGFKVNKTELEALRTRYANVKLKILRHTMVQDHLKSFSDRALYLRTLLEYLKSRNETAIYEYLEVLRQKKDNRYDQFGDAKIVPPHGSLEEAVKHYIACGSESALAFL